MKTITLISLFMMLGMVSYGQKFKQKSFDLMVRQLLSHTVDEVRSDEIKNDSSILFIDARERREFDISHIGEALWVGYDDFDTSRIEGVDRDRKVVVYCSVGYRSEKVGEKMEAAGFKSVYNLAGGIFDWTNKGLPIVDSLGQSTDKVHAFNKAWGIWLNEAEKVYK